MIVVYEGKRIVAVYSRPPVSLEEQLQAEGKTFDVLPDTASDDLLGRYVEIDPLLGPIYLRKRALDIRVITPSAIDSPLTGQTIQVVNVPMGATVTLGEISLARRETFVAATDNATIQFRLRQPGALLIQVEHDEYETFSKMLTVVGERSYEEIKDNVVEI